MFEGFVNPALLAGVGLASVPILIHLLNRQRHRPMPWAAMRFVLAAYRRTRRRVQLEDWLLLALRALAVAALALAVARPFTSAGGPLAGLTETRRDLALVLDASASTGYRGEVDTVFEREVERARELIAALDGSRGDRAHLVLAGSTPRLLAWGDPRNALSALEALEGPTDEALDLGLALGTVLEFAREEAASTDESRVEVRVLTDLQRGALVPAAEADQPDAATGLARVLDDLGELGVVVRVEDLSREATLPPNISVEAIAVEGALVAEGQPLEARVRVANHGDSARPAVRVALEVDGVRRPSQTVDLPARGTADAVFPVVFERSGDHALVARLEGDRLAIDDRRARVVHVPPPVRVLLVNGAPSPDFETDAVARVLVVLEPLEISDAPGGPPAPFAPTVVEPRDLERGDVDLAAHDLIWLADVESLAPEVVARLEEQVAAGAALVMTLGPRVQPEAFNERLFRADGTGLSPARLGRVVATSSRRGEHYRIRDFEEQHPALALFAEERWRALLTEAPFHAFWSASPLEDTRVLARLDDPEGSPLFLEREYDRGRVLLWTSSMQEEWTGFPTWGPALVPFVYDLVAHAGRPARPAVELAPGEAFEGELRAFPRSVELVLPDESRRRIDGEVTELPGGRWRLPRVDGPATARVGLHRVVAEGAGELLFAVGLDAEESELERMTPAELEALHPAIELAAAEEAEDDGEQAADGRGELWRGLALAALLLLTAESLWGAFVGRRRRVLP